MRCSFYELLSYTCTTIVLIRVQMLEPLAPEVTKIFDSLQRVEEAIQQKVEMLLQSTDLKQSHQEINTKVNLFTDILDKALILAHEQTLFTHTRTILSMVETRQSDLKL